MTPERFDELRANAESDTALLSPSDVIECLDEIARLAAEVYVPGSWHCPKCGFSLICAVLYAATGAVGVDHRHPAPCPNDGTPLEPTTWKRDALQMSQAMPDAGCMRLINTLRSDEGSSVEIFCDNADFNVLPNCLIAITDDWTEWVRKEFRADTLIAALAQAEAERKEWRRLHARA
jgi:hypothetical protein